MDDSGSAPFDRIRQEVSRLVETVPLVRRELPDGVREWCFAPEEEDRRVLLDLVESWDRWEDKAKPVFMDRLPGRAQEIIELLRIVRTKIGLNGTNRHFMGYVRDGSDPEAGRVFFITTLTRTLEHLATLWESVRNGPSSLPDTATSSKGT